jgi:hypothetical protein
VPSKPPVLVYENDAKRLSKDGHPFWLAGSAISSPIAGTLLWPLKRIGVDDLGATLAKSPSCAADPDGA